MAPRQPFRIWSSSSRLAPRTVHKEHEPVGEGPPTHPPTQCSSRPSSSSRSPAQRHSPPRPPLRPPRPRRQTRQPPPRTPLAMALLLAPVCRAMGSRTRTRARRVSGTGAGVDLQQQSSSDTPINPSPRANPTPVQVNFTRSYFTFPVDFIIDNNVYPPPPGSNSTIMLEQTVTLNLYAEGDAIPVTWAHVTPQGQIWCPEASSCSFGNDLLPSMRSPATNKDWPGLKYRALFNETFGGGSYVRGELGRLDPAALFGNATQKFYVQLVGDGKGQFENHTLNHNGPICRCHEAGAGRRGRRRGHADTHAPQTTQRPSCSRCRTPPPHTPKHTPTAPSSTVPAANGPRRPPSRALRRSWGSRRRSSPLLCSSLCLFSEANGLRDADVRYQMHAICQVSCPLTARDMQTYGRRSASRRPRGAPLLSRHVSVSYQFLGSDMSLERHCVGGSTSMSCVMCVMANLSVEGRGAKEGVGCGGTVVRGTFVTMDGRTRHVGALSRQTLLTLLKRDAPSRKVGRQCGKRAMLVSLAEPSQACRGSVPNAGCAVTLLGDMQYTPRAQHRMHARCQHTCTTCDA